MLAQVPPFGLFQMLASQLTLPGDDVVFLGRANDDLRRHELFLAHLRVSRHFADLNKVNSFSSPSFYFKMF